MNENELRNNTLATFVEGENNREESKEESGKMWRSIVTCVPVQIKPMSKRSQHAIEELQQEQFVHDQAGNHRQVLPNIRPMPKAKFVYKGLAYKEVKKIPGIINENDDNHSSNSLKKPLIDYNLAQAYIRYEVNAERAKTILRPALPSPSPPPPTTATGSHTADQQHSRNTTSLDLRQMRKRIVRGTTFGVRPIAQSASWMSGRSQNKSALSSEVFLPGKRIQTSNSALTEPLLSLYTSSTQQHAIAHSTPILSQQTFEISPLNNPIPV